jgi:CRP/FNR family transcriptional regulator, cyclic AMP receptor protein
MTRGLRSVRRRVLIDGVRFGKNAKVEMISKVPLFAGLSKRDLTQIASLADEISLAEGRTMTREGEPGREFFVLLEGDAAVRRKGRKVRTLGGGDFFGEIALVSERPRTATVVAETPVRALVVTDRAFRSLMKQEPRIQAKVLEAVIERISGDDL